mmetsp:Transcript_7504/g.13150  ORF Transcript_7504/g.13150 Transcript_7504/m.13150 type:complete len:110 (+) Transcript_7504:1136-1465(+)
MSTLRLYHQRLDHPAGEEPGNAQDPSQCSVWQASGFLSLVEWDALDGAPIGAAAIDDEERVDFLDAAAAVPVAASDLAPVSNVAGVAVEHSVLVALCLAGAKHSVRPYA